MHVKEQACNAATKPLADVSQSRVSRIGERIFEPDTFELGACILVGISQPSRSPKRLRTPRATPPSSPSYLAVCRGASPLSSIPTPDKRSLCAAIGRFELESTSTLPRPYTFYAITTSPRLAGGEPTKPAPGWHSQALRNGRSIWKRMIGSRSLSTTNPMVDPPTPLLIFSATRLIRRARCRRSGCAQRFQQRVVDFDLGSARGVTELCNDRVITFFDDP